MVRAPRSLPAKVPVCSNVLAWRCFPVPIETVERQKNLPMLKAGAVMNCPNPAAILARDLEPAGFPRRSWLSPAQCFSFFQLP